MARLRIRVELNRGGVGVPLQKLASVVEQAQKFFHMLAEDVHVDQSKGEWLGFDFDHESLNFTAEFVGPVTPEQVGAFHAAFGGSTSLRRATIAQFACITDAIGEDELIGFGLFLKDEGDEPAEWRCLSRRDALRISEEMQLLIGASGEQDQDTRLPAAASSGNGTRWFSERHERGPEPAKWVSYVREVEANLDRRIGRVEKAIEDQSGLIGDLHQKSAATEDSVRRLLGAVEGFCTQTTRQLEAMSPTAASTPALPAAPHPDPLAAFEETSFPAVPLHVALPAGLAPAPSAPAKASAEQWAPATAGTGAAPKIKPDLAPAIAPWRDPARGRRLMAGAALLAAGVAMLSTWAWQNLSATDPAAEVKASDRETHVARAQPPTSPTATTPPTTAAATPTVSAVKSATVVSPQTAGRTGGSVRLEASELTWVSVRSAEGNSVLNRLFAPGDDQTIELPTGGTLRVGNAGGLHVRFNGQPIEPLGAHGQVRDVVFRNGGYKIGAAE